MISLDITLKVITVILAVLSAGTVVYLQIQAAKQDKKASEKLAAAESRAAEQPEKTKPAWDLARATLESYFNRNLSQISSIFWLSVIVMIIGFSIIIWGASHAIQEPSVVVPASIAMLAGVITEFVGATFLFIYRSTIQQAINYSRTLERINSVGMAMQILDTLPDGAKSTDLKSLTKARLVEQLLAQAGGISREKETMTGGPPAKKKPKVAGDETI